MANLNKVPELREIPSKGDQSGTIGIIEHGIPVDFQIKRIYFIHNVAGNSVRGSHAHKNLTQFIFAVSGSFEIELKNHADSFRFTLDSPRSGIYVPPGYWRTLRNFSVNAVCLVVASSEYDESDYIRNLDEFLNWSKLHG